MSDLLRHPPGTYAITDKAKVRLLDAGYDPNIALLQHMQGMWHTSRGTTEVHDVPEHGIYHHRLSVCFTGPGDQVVIMGERAGILTVACPEEFEGLGPDAMPGP